MLYILLALLGLSVVCVRAQNETYNDCRKIPNYPFNYSLAAAASPFLILRSSVLSENCSTALLTGPIPLGNNTDNYFFLIIRDNQVLYLSTLVSTMSQTSFSQATTCDAGTKLTFKFLPYDLTGPDPNYVIYLCDENNGTILEVRGYGRNQKAASTIDGLIKQYLSKIPGGDKAEDVWANCPNTPYCGGFFN